jgi:hypothetical protein
LKTNGRQIGANGIENQLMMLKEQETLKNLKPYLFIPLYSNENQVIQKDDLWNLKLLYLNWVPLIIVLGI